MKAKQVKFSIIGSILIAIIFFGIIELTTRTISWFSGKGFTIGLHELQANDPSITSIYKWHPFTGFTFTPNKEFGASHPNQKGRSAISVDQHSFLSNGQKFGYQKADNEIRIAIIGASTTASLNLSYQDNWPGRLGSLVQNSFPDKKITIINAGVPGFNTAQSIGNLALRVMPFNPDIVIIYHAYNDLKAVNNSSGFKPDYSHIHPKPYGYHKQPSLFSRLLNHSMFYVRVKKSYRELQDNKKLVQVATAVKNEDNRLSEITPEAVQAFDQHMRILVSIAKAGGAKVIMSSFATLHDPTLDYTDKEMIKSLSKLKKIELYSIARYTPNLKLPAVFQGIRKYNEVLNTISRQEEIGWVDNALLVPNDEKYFVDRVHFSKNGASLMAKNFFPVVVENLKQIPQ